MNDIDFEYPPLGKVVHGLESEEDIPLEEIRADLLRKGYDPDALISRLQTQATALSAEARLSWMKQGERVQTGLDAMLGDAKSWVERSGEEITQAFNNILEGRYGDSAQLRVRSAFSNATEVTLQSKAAFLDEVELLLAMKQQSQNLKEK